MNENLGLRFDLSALHADPLLTRHRGKVIPLETITLRPDVQAIACRAWEDRTRAEYVGVMIVRHFHGLLVDLNAPMDLQEIALAMLIQEQQHAQLCMGAARSLGSDGEVAFDLEELQLKRTEQELELQFLSMLIGTYCCGEVVAHVLLRHAIKAVEDTPYRDILRRIAQDEVLHAHIGPAILRTIRDEAAPKWIAYPGDEWVGQVAIHHMKVLAERDVIEPDEAELFLDPEAAEQLRAVGIPPSNPFKEAYLKGVRNVVPKALARAGVELALDAT